MESKSVEAMSEALLQNIYIIIGIISGTIGIAYAILRIVRWFQNLNRQISDIRQQIGDMRLGLHAVSSLIYALYSAFLELYNKIGRGESVSVNDIVNSAIASVGRTSMRIIQEKIIGEYLQLPLKESGGLDPNGETRKKELLRKFQEGGITYEEALELRTLLEKQRRNHEDAGNIVAALLALIILLLLLAYIASLTTSERKGG